MYGILHTEINGKLVREKVPSHTGSYAKYYEDLYDTLVHGKPVKEKPEHGFNTIRLIELAFESHQQQRTIACTGLLDAPYR